jgi:cephalosporin-C deacetylase-like acetyl esterase
MRDGKQRATASSAQRHETNHPSQPTPMTDFHKYWADVCAEVDACDRDWELIERAERIAANGAEWRIDWVRYSSVGDALVWGWLATPVDRAPNGAGMLWYPGYSYGTPPPDATCLVPGVVTICINVHGNEPGTPYVNPAGKNDYIFRGIDDPSVFVLRRIAQHALRAVDVLAEQRLVEAGRIASAGMSQGAMLAIVVAANSPLPKLCLADMPFLSNVPVTMRQSNSPIYRALRDYVDGDARAGAAAMDTLALFDPLNHAPQVTVPTTLSAGGRDPSVKIDGVRSVYDSLGTLNKHLEFYPDAGHVFLPEMNKSHGEWIERGLLSKQEPSAGG